jgi:hypothetical protein
VKKPVTNVAASVRARLLQDARGRKADFQLVLQRYVVERLLYRLGESDLRDRFVLKGAMLFVLWDVTIHRPTKDLDLAGYWPRDASSLMDAFRRICAVPCPADGVEFLVDSLRAEPIRDRTEYQGFRLRLQARLEAAVVPLQIDVGFGDAIVPAAELSTYPALLDAPAPRIRAYPREASVAEKLHAMVLLGVENTRLKDFYDVHLLSIRFAFAGERLVGAIAATFAQRATAIPVEQPVALTPGFYSDAARAAQWRQYLMRTKLEDAPSDWASVGEAIGRFLGAPLRALAAGQPFGGTWPAGGPWR